MKKKFVLPIMVLSASMMLGGLASCKTTIGGGNGDSTSSVVAQAYTGQGAPADDLGKDGDTYIDTLTGKSYKKEGGKWVEISPTAKSLSGEGAPSDSLGNDGDKYTDILSGATYEKENGKWVKKSDGDTTYTITFNLNGGAFADGSTTYPNQTVREGRWITKPASDPLKEHCEFLGWYAEGQDTAWNFKGTSVYGDVTLVAQWRVKTEDKITVTVDPGNGDATYEKETYVGDYFYPSTPKKEGYSFLGWYIDGTKFNGTITAEMAGKTITAMFEKSKFGVTYEVEDNGEVTITGLLNINAVSIDIPEQIGGRNVTKIASTAFANRVYLESINLPKTIKEIESGAFYKAYRLVSVTVDSDNLYFTSDNGILYSKNKDTLVLYPTKAGSTFTVPATVKKIGDYAFYYSMDMGISSIRFNEGLEEIGDYAFAYNETITDISFPSTLKKIGSHAFYGNASADEDAGYISPNGMITNASLNEGLEEIGEMAFANQYFKDTLTLPSTIKKIGDYAFCNCTAIEKVVLPKNLEVYGDNAFGGATAVGEFAIDSSNANFSIYDGMLYNKNRTILIQCPSNRFDDVVIPEGVVEIARHAFFMVDEVQNYTFPSTVTKFGYRAFAHTYHLSSFTIPNSVTEIGENCFDLSGISSLTIGTGLTAIPDQAFIETKLTSVTIPGNVKSIGEEAFSLCSSLASVTLSEGVEEIKDAAFSGAALTSLAMPASLKSIGDYAFDSCGITTLNVGAGLEKLGTMAFVSKAGVNTIENIVVNASNANFANDSNNKYLLSKDGKKLYFASYKAGTLGTDEMYSVDLSGLSIESIEEGAFAYCRLTSAVTFPSTLKTIGDYAFYYTKIKALEFPANLTKIGVAAFYFTYVKTATFNEGLLEIDNHAFEMSDLTGAALPNSLKRIGDSAFSKVMSLKTLSLGTNLEEIGKEAFLNTSIGMDSDVTLAIPATCTKIGQGAFAANGTIRGVEFKDITVAEDNPNFKAQNGFLLSKDGATVLGYAAGREGMMVFPEGVTTVAAYSMSYPKLANLNATGVTLPNTVTTIGEYAFAHMSGLKSLTVPSSVTYVAGYAFTNWGSSQILRFGCSEEYALMNYAQYYVNGCNAAVTYSYGA